MAQLFGARMTAPMGDTHPPAVATVAGAMGRYLLSQERPLPPFLARLTA